MFEIVGNKDKIRPAALKFTSKANEMMQDGGLKEDMKKKFEDRGGMLNKIPGVDGNSISELLGGKLENMVFAPEETENGFKIKVPMLSDISAKPVIGKILKAHLKKAKDNLEEFMEQIQYCPNCEDVTDENVCPECGNENLEKIVYDIR